jgi:hypothetical protein
MAAYHRDDYFIDLSGNSDLGDLALRRSDPLDACPTGADAVTYPRKLSLDGIKRYMKGSAMRSRTLNNMAVWIASLSILLLIVAACASTGGQAPPPEGAALPTSAPIELTGAPVALTSVASTPAPVVTQSPAIQEARRITLEWPPTIRVGDSDVIRLTIEVDAQGNLTPTAQIEGHETRGETVLIPNLYDTHNVMAEARLDMAGMQVTPEGEVGEPLLPGQSVTFYWSVRPQEVGAYRGTVWVHLRFIPRAGGEELRSPLTAQLVEVQAVNLLGLGGNTARWLGGLGTLAGSFFSLENLLPWVVGLLRKKKRSGG